MCGIIMTHNGNFRKWISRCQQRLMCVEATIDICKYCKLYDWMKSNAKQREKPNHKFIENIKTEQIIECRVYNEIECYPKRKNNWRKLSSASSIISNHKRKRTILWRKMVPHRRSEMNLVIPIFRCDHSI